LFENSSLIVFANQTRNSTTAFLLFDDEVITLMDNNAFNLTSCINVKWYNGKVRFETPAHAIDICPETFYNYINFINFDLTVDFIDSNILGGIIGQTSTTNFTVNNLIESDYIEESLTSSVSYSFYKNLFTLKCNTKSFNYIIYIILVL